MSKKHGLFRWMTAVVGAVAVVVLYSGCRPAGTYTFPEIGWQFSDSVSVAHTVADTQQVYRLRLSLWVTDEYRFRNLYVRFRLEGPKAFRQMSQTQFLLTDSAGNWRVPKGWNGTYQFETTLNPAARFPNPGDYTFWLTQYMRADTLAGVRALHLSVEPMED